MSLPTTGVIRADFSKSIQPHQPSYPHPGSHDKTAVSAAAAVFPRHTSDRTQLVVRSPRNARFVPMALHPLSQFSQPPALMCTIFNARSVASGFTHSTRADQSPADRFSFPSGLSPSVRGPGTLYSTKTKATSPYAPYLK